MSFQTGIRVVPPPGPEVSGPARLRAWLTHLASAPNAVWVRELKQAARLTRTPFILLAVTLLATLLIATIGALMIGFSFGGSIGVALFHTFFSLSFFVVTLAGTAVAANSIASEREGRTWEALLLTGLPSTAIARGKFWAAYTSVALYIVMMAPIGAVPFLFGGVTAIETLIAFALLFVLAGLSVSFGLAVSSKMESLRGAILVTLAVAVVASPNLFLALAFGGATAAHALWPLVPEGWPIWMPAAYTRAPFDLRYVSLLLVAPALVVGLIAWFLHEATVANLTSVTDDRSTGLRRWFVVTGALGAVSTAVATAGVPRDHLVPAMGGLSAFFVLLTFGAFVFAGEPIGPSRRVLRGWSEKRVGPVGRALGPGVMRAAWAQLVTGLGGAGLIAVVAAVALTLRREPRHVLVVLVFAFYGVCFHVFVVGFGAWLRARTGTAMTARLVLLVGLFLASVGPWILAALGGAIGRGTALRNTLIAAPSPFYVLSVTEEIINPRHDPTSIVVVCAVAACAWALLGAGLLGSAALRCRRIIRDHERALAEGDAFLRAEDEGRSAPAVAS
ncbi:MAG: ABC transporter permease [Myxococcales bacterium]|nr:MAG: ABC transporter permease [Myxococcales bacterium]